ncbi:unnamed protein product [Victoria cruziana]
MSSLFDSNVSSHYAIVEAASICRRAFVVAAFVCQFRAFPVAADRLAAAIPSISSCGRSSCSELWHVAGICLIIPASSGVLQRAPTFSSTVERVEGCPPPFYSTINPQLASSFESLQNTMIFLFPDIPCTPGNSLQQRICCSTSTTVGQSPTGDLSEQWVLESSLEGAISLRSSCAPS